MNKKICLFFDRAYVDAHYCFREMAVQFLKKGWRVDLYMPFGASHPVPSFESTEIRIIFIDHSKTGLLKVMMQILRGHYKAIVATPQWTLYWAVKLAYFLKIPVICLSDEVYTWDPKTWSMAQQQMPSALKWKKREAWAHQRSMMTIALGEERYGLIKKENVLPEHQPHVIIPNAPAGKANKETSVFYREQLAISNEKIILLHSGGLAWSFTKPLIAMAGSWDEQYQVVIQGRIQEQSNGGQAMRNVKMATSVLPSDRMHHATSSADIGLMLYNRDIPSENRNGNTAGKLGLYLSCGLPVICCNLDSLRWVEKENCGLWVSQLEDIPSAAKKIKENYDVMSQAAMRVFDKRFEYAQHFEVFYEMFNQLLKREN